MNGSATPNVIGSRPPGSGPLAMSSSSLFCQKHSASATPKITSEMMILVRSSSRWSTSETSSSWETGLALTFATATSLLLVVTTSASTGCGRAAAASFLASLSSSSSPVIPATDPLNSFRPLPMDLPSSGRRFGPKMIRAMIKHDRYLGYSDVRHVVAPVSKVGVVLPGCFDARTRAWITSVPEIADRCLISTAR